MLSKRDGDNICIDNWGRSYNCDSVWHNYGRWIFLVILIVAAALFFFLFSCFSARRRKASGQRPLYGTAWAANPPPFYSSQPAAPPPPYTADAAPGTQIVPPSTAARGPPPGGYYAPDIEAQTGHNMNRNSRGYFGGTGTTGEVVELQEPPSAYHQGRETASPRSPTFGAPPPGPPPGYSSADKPVFK